MSEFDFEEIEEELEIVIPNIYRMFIGAIENANYDLGRHRIYHDTETVIRGNIKTRFDLEDANPKWEPRYFDFGVGDGCGNYFFLTADNFDNDLVKLWSHDPPDIEHVSSGTDFFHQLLNEIKLEFQGPEKYYFDGNRTWDLPN